MSRVPLASIKTLTLYAGKHTNARRTTHVPQLECTGSVCRDYQPSAVQCTNTGGTDTDIDWKCEADLPSSLRFGRLQVSCEGWDRPGDPYVLKGSCGLQYSLVRIPTPGTESSISYTYLLLIGAFLLAIYLYINRSLRLANPFTSTRQTPGGGGGPGWRSTYRGGGPTSSDSDRGAPPPPYTKHPHPSDPQTQSGWTPGFWSGLGAGGLAAATYHLLTRPRDGYDPPRDRYDVPRGTTWDWERPGTRTGAFQPEASAGRRRAFEGGAGSSTGPGTQLGEMRRATGFGGTSVR